MRRKQQSEEEVTYGTNPLHPKCPSTCLASWMGDQWCDTECASEDCGKDGGDCEGWCAPDCKPGWVGDGHCDFDCFRPECEWDKEDCAKNYTCKQNGDAGNASVDLHIRRSKNACSKKSLFATHIITSDRRIYSQFLYGH